MRIHRLLAALVPFILTGALALFGSGCASTIQYPPFPDQTKRIENPEQARIYVIRPAHFFGAGGTIRFSATTPESTGPWVSRNYRIVGEISAASYICWEAAPGTMEIERVEDKPDTRFRLNVVAGKVYYVRAGTRPGWIKGHATLSMIPESEGQALLRKCKPPANQTKQTTP